MTRINSAIHPKNLTDQHLLAELRELPRIFTAVNKRIKKEIGFTDIPNQFVLGTGHVKFFYNKIRFLRFRQQLLMFEYSLRFQKTYYFEREQINFVDNNLHNSYSPTEIEKQLLIERISTRIKNSKQAPRYYGKEITKEQAIELLKS